MGVMRKLLLCSGLIAAAALPFTADAFGFGHFGHFGHGGLFGVLLLVAVVVALVALAGNANRR
jgi:hypothetical protein